MALDRVDFEEQRQIVDGLRTEVEHGVAGSFAYIGDVSETACLEALDEVGSKVALVELRSSEASIELGDVKGCLVCLRDHFPELLELLWLHFPLEVNETVQGARYFKVEDVEGALHSYLDLKRMRWRIFGIEIFLINGARDGLQYGGA